MKNNELPGWTLPELLVVMILTGLIFMAALDGADLAGRFTSRLKERWSGADRLREGFCRLDYLFSVADSLLSESNGYRMYRNGGKDAFFRKENDLLICTYRGMTDTLFRDVEKMTVWKDSLLLVIPHRNSPVKLLFGLTVRPENRVKTRISQRERVYAEKYRSGTGGK